MTFMSSLMGTNMMTAILILSSIWTVTSFQFALPFQINNPRGQQINPTLSASPLSRLFARRSRRDDFTNDGSSKGFGAKKKLNDKDKNKYINITSVKDVDAALNDEIEGALRAADEVTEKDGAASATAAVDDDNVPLVDTVKLLKQKDDSDSPTTWDNFKESVYQAADQNKSKQPSLKETPGSKAMKEYTSIDVKASDDDVDTTDIMTNEERNLLLQAQQEAREAEALLRQAELESARLEQELELLPLLEDEVVIEENLSFEPDTVGEEDALTSMASAYQAALDAANDNVNLLSDQIEELEGELSVALSKLDFVGEEKERISAEYAYLASNYREYKMKTDEEGEGLNEQMEGYAIKIASLEEEIAELKVELAKATSEADKWKADYESIQNELTQKLESSLKQQKDLQDTLDDVSSTFENTLTNSQNEYESSLNAITTEYELALSESKKMIAALRTSLRKTRSEAKSLISSEEDRVQTVDEVRATMNDEVEKLRGALKGLEGREMEDQEVLRRQREERDLLMEEIESLKRSIEEEQSKSAASSDEFTLTLEAYSKKEDELNAMIQNKNVDIDNLTKQVETLRMEISSLEKGRGDADELSSVNARLTAELEEALSLLQQEKTAVGAMEQKVTSLQQELSTKQNLASATQKALEETQANLNAVKVQFDNEQKSANELQSELKSTRDRLADLELSSKTTMDKQQLAAAKEKKELDSKIEVLTAQLKNASDKLDKNQQSVMSYEEELQRLATQLGQSKTSGEGLQQTLDETRAQLNASNDELTNEKQVVENLQAALKSTQARLVDMELSSKSTASERELAAENERRTLQSQIEKLDAQLKATSEKMSSGEEKIKLYEERVQSITDQLKQSESNVDRLEQELAAVKEQAQAALAKESDRRKQLENQIVQLKDEMNSSLAQADAEIKKRNDALKSKEVLEAQMQTKLDQLQKDMASARSSVTAKTEEAQSLQGLVEKLKADLTREAQLREEVSKGKQGLETLFQKKVSEWQKEMADVQAKAEKEVQSKNEELKRLDVMVATLKGDLAKVAQERADASTSKSSLESTLKSQIAQLQKEIGDVKAKAGASIASKNDDLKKMESVIVQLKSDVAEQMRLKDEALKGKADLDAALQKKMAQLQADASTTSQAKEKEMVELNTLIARLRNEIKVESDRKNEAIKSRESAESSLKSKIDQLLGDISANRAKSEEAIRSKDNELKQRDTTVSMLKADLSKLLKVKDDALTERDRLEKELSAQIFQLKNNMDQTRAQAESTIASERKLKDEAIRSKAELERNIGDMQKNLASMKQMADSISKEKNDLEKKLQASITQAQADVDATVQNKSIELKEMNDLAANLKKELEEQTLRVKQMEAEIKESQSKASPVQITLKAAVPSKASEEVVQNSVSKSKSTSKANQQTNSMSGRGFADIKAATKVSAPSKPSQKAPEKPATKSGVGFAKGTRKIVSKSASNSSSTPIKPTTAEQAELERKARLEAAEEARKLNESKRVTLALEQLSKNSPQNQAGQQEQQEPPPAQEPKAEEIPTAAKVYVGTKPKYVRVENEPPKKTVSLKTLVKGKEVGAKNSFPQRKESPAPSTQAPAQPSNQATQRASPLKSIVSKEISLPKQVFPERKRAPVPSSQQATSVRYQQSPEQSSALKNVVVKSAKTGSNAFPERGQSPSPSSQAPTPVADSPRKGETGPPLKTIIATETSTSTSSFPERKVTLPPSSQAPSPPTKESASDDHVREGLTLRRYTQTRKASTSLGGLANPSSNQGPLANVDEAMSERKPKAKSSSSFANLASLVGNGSNSISRDRATVNQARSVSTKLGGIAKNPGERSGSGQVPVSKISANGVTESRQKTPATSAKESGDPQEAFQRALLSSRLGNVKSTKTDVQKPKPETSKTKNTPPPSTGFSSLSAIIQSRDKRTVTTTTVNKDRAKASLFPETGGSALSRLLNK